MSHLGDRASALVDGQLSIEATERAHAHLAGCRNCRDAVEAERLLKLRLSCLAEPAVSGDLMTRLLALGGPSGPLPPRPGHVPGSPRPAAVPIADRALVGAEVGAEVDAGLLRSAVPAFALTGADATRSGSSRRLPGRPAPARPGSGRPTGSGPALRHPAGRPVLRFALGVGRGRRARLAGAVLGALGVVGAGVGGLVLVSQASGGAPGAPSPVMDSMLARRPVATTPLLPQNVSLNLTATLPAPRPTPSPSDR